MRILFDQGTPAPLRKLLDPHEVETVFERGWSRLSNGELLEVAQREGFEILVTTDKKLRHQQSFIGLRIAVIVLSSTSWPRIRKAAAVIKAAVDAALPGNLKEVDIP